MVSLKALFCVLFFRFRGLLKYTVHRSCWCLIARGNSVVVANHGETAGEHDPSLGGHGQAVLPGGGKTKARQGGVSAAE